jgi:hypothetical protein
MFRRSVISVAGSSSTPLAVAHGTQRVGQQVFAHAAQAVQRQDRLAAVFAQHHELRLGLGRPCRR